jgi:glycosyltransferase involved in cell wall biosynthesis
MKIIYVENVRIPSERAHAYQIVQTCAWFARLGHEVVLVNPDRAGGRDVFEAFGIEKDLFRHVRLRVVDPLSWSWFPFKKLAYVLQRFSFALAVKEWASAQHADMWYTRDPAVVDVLKRANRPFALELHDRPDAQPRRWKRIRAFVSRYVVITNGLAKMLHGLGVDDHMIRVAPDGYDPKDLLSTRDRVQQRQRLGLLEDAFVAMYTGSLYPWKGVDLVVGAWHRTDARAHLVVIGGPEGDRKRLEGLVGPGAASRVHFFPTMDHVLAIQSLAAADVGLLTSSDAEDIGRLYTSPLKQFEYLATGLPIVASDVPSSHEVLTPDVARFYPLTEDGFCEAFNRVMEDDDWLEAARQYGPALVAPYTWEARARTILQHLV